MSRKFSPKFSPKFSFVVSPLCLALVAASQPDMPARLTSQHVHDLRCAAAFAVVAAGQAHGDAAALALPPLGIRGRTYMGEVGERVATEAGLSGEAVRDLLAQAARRLGPQGAPAAARACLGELDQAVPPRPAPDAIDCLAMLDTYAQLLAARDPASPLAATLRDEARVLAIPSVDAATQARIDLARARVREALTGGPATVDADDYTACRRLARRG